MGKKLPFPILFLSKFRHYYHIWKLQRLPFWWEWVKKREARKICLVVDEKKGKRQTTFWDFLEEERDTWGVKLGLKILWGRYREFSHPYPWLHFLPCLSLGLLLSWTWGWRCCHPLLAGNMSTGWSLGDWKLRIPSETVWTFQAREILVHCDIRKLLI